MKHLSLKDIVKRLMDEDILKASTYGGAYQTLYHHINRGNIKLDYIQSNKKKIFFTSKRKYPSVAKQVKNALRD